MGCQKDIAHKIISNEANYILALKQNQGSLYDDVSPYFTGPSDFQDKTEIANTIEKMAAELKIGHVIY